MLGATLVKDGVNFAVFSKNATKVVLDLFDAPGDKQPSFSYEFDSKKNRTGDIWHVFVKGLQKNSLYLYRLDGPYNPPKGHRFNFNKYLLDPYAKSLSNGSIFLSYNKQREMGLAGVENGKLSDLSNFPKCVVIDDYFDWQGDKPLNIPLNESVIYEAHIKGYTQSDTSGVENRGTYKGFIEKIPYLKDLGVTAVELLPVYAFDANENNNVDPRTGEKLVNFWGYSPISFFAPHTQYASNKNPGEVVAEFKTLVREMHKAGLEVLLDVVYNHTAEGNEHGYTFGFRGFENSVYYLLPQSEKQYYMDFSGCGNTTNSLHPVVTRLILDSLRYWVSEMHVDGFRFDLAVAMCRDKNGNLQNNSFLMQAIADDPILSTTKLIAEPWDCGGGYMVGGFSPSNHWSEWNDRFRNDIRRFVRGDEGVATLAATRIAGSSDLYNHDGKDTNTSINFITAHDGFTLNDLVSYNSKHNYENGEENRDGSNDNNCYNHGFEGITINPKIENLRMKKLKNYMLCLMLSQGVPMILGGDEFRRTQEGNNNAFCQDNEISWVNWNLAKKNEELVRWTKKMIELRKRYAVFHRQSFFSTTTAEIEWFDLEGKNPEWDKMKRFLGFKLNGENGEDFYIAGNTDIYDVTMQLPSCSRGKSWYLLADTSIEGDGSIKDFGKEEHLNEQKRYILPANSFVVLVSK